MIIGICDDEEKYVMAIKNEVNKYLNQINCATEFRLFNQISLEDISEMATLDILFLDIEMPGLNGIQIKEFLEYYPSVLIIFISSHTGRMDESFGRNVIGFLPKPIYNEKLYFMLDKALQIKSFEHRVFQIDGRTIDSKKILFIKADHVYTRIYLADETNLFIRKNLHIWENELKDCNFIKAHRSYLVNLDAIEFVEATKVHIKDYDNVIPVSRSNGEHLLQKYKEYCRKMLRF